MRRMRINQWIWGCTILKQTKWAYHFHDNFPSPNKMNGRFIGKWWEHDNYRVFGLYFQTCFCGVTYVQKISSKLARTWDWSCWASSICGSNRSKPSTSPWMACLVLWFKWVHWYPNSDPYPSMPRWSAMWIALQFFKLTHTTRTHLAHMFWGWNWPDRMVKFQISLELATERTKWMGKQWYKHM